MINPAYLFLPLGCRTLLKNNSEPAKKIKINNGEIIYVGIEESVKAKMKLGLENEINTINIIINIDGLTLFKSSATELWPILGRSLDLKDSSPLVIGLFSGIAKPSPMEKYLRSFINEYNNLEKNGFIVNHQKLFVKIAFLRLMHQFERQ